VDDTGTLWANPIVRPLSVGVLQAARRIKTGAILNFFNELLASALDTTLT